MRGEFTLSYHFFGCNDRRNHLELFLDTDGESDLETWRHYPHAHDHRAGKYWRFSRAEPHRRIYLEFAGNVSNNRGRLRILRRGKFIDRRAGSLRSVARTDALLASDRRTRRSEVLAMHEAYPGESRRAGSLTTIRAIL